MHKCTTQLKISNLKNNLMGLTNSELMRSNITNPSIKKKAYFKLTNINWNQKTIP